MYKLLKSSTLKTLLLVLLVSWSYKSNSQTVINPVTNDSIVRLQKEVAVQVLKDLNKKDALEKENALLKTDTSTLKKLVDQYKIDSATQAKKDQLYSDIRLLQSSKDAKYDKAISDLEKNLTWSKVKTTASELLLLGAVIYIIFGK